MLVVISPAKKLDMDEAPLPQGAPDPSEPAFAEEAAELAQVAQGLNAAELGRLMRISASLAELNAARFAAFGDQPRKPAALAFAGDTYRGLEAATLDADALRWGQARLRILSGLYGVLRPLDLIEPYRLEMGSRLHTPRGRTLYDWWGDRIARALNDAAAESGATVLVNCASQEYFGAVDMEALALRVVTPVFMEVKAGKPQVVSFYAKQARGAMARFVLERRLEEPGDLAGFDTGGYRFEPEMSEPDRPVFLRGEA
ncbi:MAG: peroxide stress protein YaaA [Rhodosalinus sp.]